MKKFFCTVASLLIFFSVSHAQEYGMSFKISTLGLNLEVARSFGEKVNLKVSGAYFGYTLDEQGSEADDYLYSGQIDLFSLGLLLDYMPFGGAFRLTGGVMYNLNEGSLSMKPSKTYTIGGDVYSPDKLGNLDALVDFNKFAPYFGIGLGNPTSGKRGIKFNFDIGTIYQGAPGVGLTANGLIAPSAAPDQETVLADNISWFKWYPVLSFGITYKF